MWRLLKAELDYNRTVLVFLFVLNIPIFVWILTWQWWNPERNMLLMIMMMFISTGLAVGITTGNIGRWSKEKRLRYQVLLPITINRIGVARVIFPLLFWTSLVLSFWICVLIFRPFSINQRMLMQIFSFSGLVISLNGAAFLSNDLSICFDESNQKQLLWIITLLWVPIVLFLLLLFFVPYRFQHSFLHLREQLYFSFWGTFGLVLFGLSLTYLNVLIFAKRKYYIE